MKPSAITLSILLILTLFFIIQSCSPASETQKLTTESYNDESHLGASTPGLAIQMKYIQHWTHKLGLSVESRNTELIEFYHHELEEGIEDLIASIKEYDGYPIAELAETILMPQIKAFESAEESGDWNQITQAYQTIITSCNSCHQASGHGYIKIIEGFGNNPFNQDFSTQ
jgi:cytochrome c553